MAISRTQTSKQLTGGNKMAKKKTKGCNRKKMMGGVAAMKKKKGYAKVGANMKKKGYARGGVRRK